jgi:hypothetical protein
MFSPAVLSWLLLGYGPAWPHPQRSLYEEHQLDSALLKIEVYGNPQDDICSIFKGLLDCSYDANLRI